MGKHSLCILVENGSKCSHERNIIFLDEMGSPKWLAGITSLASAIFLTQKAEGFMKTGLKSIDDIATNRIIEY